MQHGAEVLAAFQDGETRLIYARPRAGGSLWMLPDGEAKQHRAFAKAELMCPVHECGQPKLTTVARAPRKRDGFSHLAGGGHAPESLFHLQAKQRIADWLTEHYPRSSVHIEEQSDTNRTRIADVMITGPTGQRIAFEVQYSPITPEKWRERHDSYVEQGITDIWLWGHHGANLTEDRHLPGTVKLTPAQQLVAELGLPLLWFNPVLGDVGTASQAQYGAPWSIRTLPVSSGRFEAEPFEKFSLASDGFGSDLTRRLLADTVCFREWRQKRDAELRAQQKAADDLKAAEAARAAAEAFRRQQQLERATEVWLRSEQRASLLRRMGGTWPEWLDVTIQDPLPVPAEQWQSAVYVRFIIDLAHGNTIKRDPIITWMKQEYRLGPRPRERAMVALYRWLIAISKRGIVRRLEHKWSGRSTFYAVDPAYLPPGAWFPGVDPPVSRRLELERSLERRRQERLAEIAARPPAPPPAPDDLPEWQARIRAARHTGMKPRSESGLRRCVLCGIDLDPIYEDLGYHPYCSQTRR